MCLQSCGPILIIHFLSTVPIFCNMQVIGMVRLKDLKTLPPIDVKFAGGAMSDNTTNSDFQIVNSCLSLFMIIFG